MNPIADIRHLVTKNWFYSITLGTVLACLKMILSESFFIGHFHWQELFIFLPTMAIGLPVVLVLSTPALVAALIGIPGFKQFATSPMRTRYHLCLLLLALLWGTSALIIPFVLNTSLSNPEVFSTLCLLSFSSTFMFLNDEKLIAMLSEED